MQFDNCAECFDEKEMTGEDDAKTVYIGVELSDVVAITNGTCEKQFNICEKQFDGRKKPPDGAADLFVDTAKQFDSDAE